MIEVKPAYVLCSYEPDPIVEKEERERVNLLAQRDFLIRSYGMLEQVRNIELKKYAKDSFFLNWQHI